MARNNLITRKLYSIYLSPNYKANNGHILYHILTNKVIICSRKLTVILILENITDIINKKVNNKDLKIQSLRTAMVICSMTKIILLE